MPAAKVVVKAVFEKDPPDSPVHTHGYTAEITKGATCTEAGIRTYRCACGDSYTESIPAAGHSYLSNMTKEPTVSAEGVMTYTCERCGDSYTEPIKRLEDTSSKPAGRPESGIPFIQAEFGKNGWENIREEIGRAKDQGTVTVDMNGASVVPGNVLEYVRGRDVTLVFDMGNGIAWSVNGKSIREGNIGDIDFSVKTGTKTIPMGIVNSLTGERYSIQISLAYDGEFGFTAVLSIDLGGESSGLYANLYYYNAGSGKLEYVCSEQIAGDGTVELTFTHASDYLIVIDKEPAGSTETPAVSESPAASESNHGAETSDGDTAPSSPQTGNGWNPWTVIAIGAMLLLIGFGIFLIWKKRKE